MEVTQERVPEATTDGSRYRAFTSQFVLFVQNTLLLIRSTISKPNDQDESVAIDSSFPSSSSSSSPNPRTPRTRTVFRNPSFRNSQLELPYYHAPDSSQHTEHILDQNPNSISSSIIAIFREQDLGRHVLVLTVPLTTALIMVYDRDPSSLEVSLMLLFLPLGFAATWNGIMLREMYPRASNFAEQLGVAFIFLSFFGLLGFSLPPNLAWVPVLCFALSLLPFILARCSERGLSKVNQMKEVQALAAGGLHNSFWTKNNTPAKCQGFAVHNTDIICCSFVDTFWLSGKYCHRCKL